MRAESKLIKLVHYVSKWLPQTAAWLYNEVRFLPPQLVENHVVCDEVWGLDQFPMPHVHSLQYLPRWRQNVLRCWRKLGLTHANDVHLPFLESVLREVDPDVLHTHFGHMGWVNTRVAGKHRAKQVVSFYGADVNYIPRKDPRWYERYREMGQRVDKVLCEGPFMAESLAKLGIPREKIGIHRLGVDSTQFRFKPRRYERGSTLRLLIVSSFREKKGIPYALEALAKFRSVSDRFELTVIGDAFVEQDEPEKQRILQTIEDTGLGTKVRLLGSQPYKTVLREAYQHHVFLAPSVTSLDGDCEGGAPVVIIEMAATGMPVVSTTHCDIPFVLSPENAPYLVAERDSVALCDALARLVAADWTSLLTANRQLVERELDAKTQGERLCTLYQNLL